MAKKKMYFKKKAVLKAISKYTRRKLHYVFSVQWTDNTLYIDGQQQTSFKLFDAVQGNTAEYQNLGKQYAQVKLRGVNIEAVNSTISGGYNFGLCLGQANDATTFDNVRTQPNIMLLSQYAKTRMYVPVSGSFTSTNDIQIFNNMKIIPFAQGTPTARFTIRLTLYCTFKTNL